MGSLYLPSFYIKGFKSIEEMDLKSLSAINLIAGDNNVGKSTILEAIYAFVYQGFFLTLKQLTFQRMSYTAADFDIEYTSERLSLITQLFNGWEFKGGKSIVLHTGPDRNVELTLGYIFIENLKTEDGLFAKTIFKEDDKFAVDAFCKGIRIKADNNEFIYSLETSTVVSNKIKPYVPIQFIHTSSLNKSLNSKLWDDIALTGLEKHVVDALRIIEPDIDNLAFIEDPYTESGKLIRVPYITFKNKFGRYPLSVMGDGMNRILSIILGLVSSKDGVCLIDEIENGIYYKRQPELWDMICHLVKDLNIQLFATTHSLDCIRNFSTSATDNSQFIRLEKRKTGIKAVCYNPDELKVALENDIELR